ncbi:MAG TPA: PilZ domain-containing protein [Thermodesulfobacteriota bacterium]|nr:PilZ domain-containing protein [Thermodesulfobacteriota bacterium]
MGRVRRRKRNQNEEGRQHPRVSLNLPIEYYASNHTPHPGRTCNLSPGGVMLNISERLGSGQQIKLAIFFCLGARIEAVKVNSQVVWVDGDHYNGGFRAGVKFIDLSPKDKNKLQKFFE